MSYCNIICLYPSLYRHLKRHILEDDDACQLLWFMVEERWPEAHDDME